LVAAPGSDDVATAWPVPGPPPGSDITTITATITNVAKPATATPVVRRRLEGIGVSVETVWRGW
jgi:hypothetical protein